MKTQLHKVKFLSHTVLISFSLLIIGCSKEKIEDTPTTNFHPIVGEWNWIKTIVTSSQQLKTPETEGYTRTLKFKNDSTVEKYQNNNFISSQSFAFVYEKNDNLNPNSDSSLFLVVGDLPSVFSIRNDTLLISRAYIDGNKEYYTKTY